MVNSFPYLLLCLFAGILFIIVATARWRIPAFFALLAACFIVGLAVKMPLANILTSIKEGFGNIMKSLGLIIVMGTTLGAVLEHNGSITVLSEFIIRKLGRKYIALSMNIIGFIVGMPVFCDSGYIILSSLNRSIAQRTGRSIYVTSISLATGLLSVHCLIPPHPGASAAAALFELDLGKLLVAGLLIAIPVSLLGYFWTCFAGKNQDVLNETEPFVPKEQQSQPSVLQSIAPIVIPVILMAAKSFSSLKTSNDGTWHQLFGALGEPVIALALGIFLALLFWKKKNLSSMSQLLAEGAEKAGGILVIIGAGGSFGAVLTAMHFGEHFSRSLPLETMGILFPFLTTLLLKTAQGSSTVAIITASSLVLPLLPALHLDSANGRLLAVLSMASGSMIISHANDAYFWVISRFSSLALRPMFRIYTLATLWMGLFSFTLVYLLSLFLPH